MVPIPHSGNSSPRVHGSMTVTARVCTALAAVGMLLASVSDAAAQAKKLGQVHEKTLSAAGWPIAITYYESTEGRDSPVVILLHMRKGNRQVWKGKAGFASELQRKGFAVIAVDLRKHGDSKPAAGGKVGKVKGAKRGVLGARDYKAMAFVDLEAVKDFIFEEHQKKKLNMRKTAIVAPEFSAPVAFAFAMADWMKTPHPDAPTLEVRTPRGQDIRAIVLLSPERSVPGLSSLSYAVSASKWSNMLASGTAGQRPGMRFLVMWGERDVVDRGGKAGQDIFERLQKVPGNEKAKRVYKAAYPKKWRGTDLIGKAFSDGKGGRFTTNTIITGFLTKYVKNLEDPWVNRESRLRRNINNNNN